MLKEQARKNRHIKPFLRHAKTLDIKPTARYNENTIKKAKRYIERPKTAITKKSACTAQLSIANNYENKMNEAIDWACRYAQEKLNEVERAILPDGYPEEDDTSENNPLGGTVELYDIMTEAELTN